jgi:alpha-N-arabinofuranosidase
LTFDEWSTLYDEESNDDPTFLFRQQNTLRDALVAGLSLNIFNNNCERVKMANISQMINILQAMILTEGKKIVLTPSYHVFEMFKVHHNSILLPLDHNTFDKPNEVGPIDFKENKIT